MPYILVTSMREPCVRRLARRRMPGRSCRVCSHCLHAHGCHSQLPGLPLDAKVVCSQTAKRAREQSITRLERKRKEGLYECLLNVSILCDIILYHIILLHYRIMFYTCMLACMCGLEDSKVHPELQACSEAESLANLSAFRRSCRARRWLRQARNVHLIKKNLIAR